MSAEKPLLIDWRPVNPTQFVSHWDEQFRSIYRQIPGMADITTCPTYNLSYQTNRGERAWAARAFATNGDEVLEYERMTVREDGNEVKTRITLTFGDNPGFSFTNEVWEVWKADDVEGNSVTTKRQLVSPGIVSLTIKNNVTARDCIQRQLREMFYTPPTV